LRSNRLRDKEVSAIASALTSQVEVLDLTLNELSPETNIDIGSTCTRQRIYTNKVAANIPELSVVAYWKQLRLGK